MILIDFSETPKQAFARGFWKGLSAPVMLFGNFDAPKPRRAKPITIQLKSDMQSFAGDWNKIGVDFNNVVAKHGKKANRTK